jgi:hypothetical protein
VSQELYDEAFEAGAKAAVAVIRAKACAEKRADVRLALIALANVIIVDLLGSKKP